MPDCRSTPVLVFVTFVLLAGVFAQSTRDVRAAEECLSKPNSPAPQGQHWYYRIDHANGRQCWRLGPEGLRVQKSAPPSGKRPAPAATTQSEAAPRAQRPVTTGTGNTSAEIAPEVNATAAPPVYWLDAPRLLNQSSSGPPVTQPPSSIGRSVGLPDSPLPDSDDPPAPTRSDVASAGDVLPQAAARAEELPRSSSAARPTPTPSIVDDDHTFALLLLMFVTLAIAGPMLHYTERRRRREARRVQPPRWAPTLTPNKPAADAKVPLAPNAGIDPVPEPPPLTSSLQTERLEKALQQLLDRLQKESLSGQSATPSPRRTENEMKKSA
jgi:hypothetical protein